MQKLLRMCFISLGLMLFAETLKAGQPFITIIDEGGNGSHLTTD